MNIWLVFAFLFVIGSFGGWCLELVYRRFFSKNNPTRKWINPGFLVGPCVPLYGFGLFIIFVSAYIGALKLQLLSLQQWQEILVVFVVSAVLMTLIEYVAGRIFIIGMNIKLWDYSGEKFNLKGIICPKFTFYWGVMATLYYLVVHYHVVSWVNWLANNLAFSFFVGMFFGFFIIDCCYTFQLSLKIRSFAKEHEIVVRYEEMKHSIAERRERLSEKRHFLLSFQTAEPLIKYMDEYFDSVVEKRKAIIQELKEEIKEELEENFQDFWDRIEEKKENYEALKKEYEEFRNELRKHKDEITKG